MATKTKMSQDNGAVAAQAPAVPAAPGDEVQFVRDDKAVVAARVLAARGDLLDLAIPDAGDGFDVVHGVPHRVYAAGCWHLPGEVGIPAAFVAEAAERPIAVGDAVT